MLRVFIMQYFPYLRHETHCKKCAESKLLIIVECRHKRRPAMLRRRLFAYTIMMSAGIAAGFFVLERYEFVRGILVMAAAGASVALADGQAFTENRNDRIRLLLFIIAGFFLFTFRFIYYETVSIPEGSSEAAGTVSLIKATDTGYEMILTGTGFKGADNIQVNIYSGSDRNTRASVSDKSIPAELADMLGKRAAAQGKISGFRTADNPGCFDQRVYMRGKGITCRLNADRITIENDKVNIYWKYRRWLIRERDSFLYLFSNGEVRGFIRGVVFGDKSGIDEETREEFSINSTGHILAVSGLHIGFLYALLRKLAGRRKTRAISALIFMIIFMYGEMTLWSAATVRAVTVLCISMLSFYIKRPADLLTSVSAAAFIILIREPYQLFDAGFQMSFLALTAIAFISEPLKHFAGDYMAALIAVQTGVAPLGAYLFNRFNPVSLLINIPVVWLAGILVPLCLSLMLVSLITGAANIPGLAVSAAEGLSEMIVKVNGWMTYDGFFSTRTVSVNAGILTGFCLCFFLLCSEWMRIRLLRHDRADIAKAFIAVLLVSSALGAASYNSFSDDEIVFVSVGQGDCTHIRSGKRDILIDGGGNTDRNIGKDTLIPYLLSNGAADIDIAFATHLHMDHFKGILELNESFPVGCTMIPAGYRREAADMQFGEMTLPENTMYAESGTRIMITDEVSVEPIWPQPGRPVNLDPDDENENNMVYMIIYRGTKIMITGDLTEEDELEMVDHYKGTDVLKCDILKVAHHGSKNSSSEAFLDAASPSAAVIQVGRNNLYGHPHNQTLERLEERGVPVYRTDLNGAVGIDIRRSGLKIDVMREVRNNNK